MPTMATNAIRLTGTLGELHAELSRMLARRGPNALVLTEVGQDNGVLVGAKALSIRDDHGLITISADEA